MKKIKRAITICEILFGFLFLYYFSYLNENGSGLDFVYLWAAAGSVFFAKGVISLLPFKKIKKPVRVFSALFDTAFSIYILCGAVLFGCMTGSMYRTAPEGCQCAVVLGAAVVYDEPSQVLRDRISTAYEYLAKNPDTDVICTGGKSDEDIISEGGCIARELAAMGIDESRIYVEQTSSTTVENIAFSREMLMKYDNAVIISSGYHVFRGKFILSALTPLKAYGLGASGFGSFTIHYMMREYAAFAVDLFRGNYRKRA